MRGEAAVVVGVGEHLIGKAIEARIVGRSDAGIEQQVREIGCERRRVVPADPLRRFPVPDAAQQVGALRAGQHGGVRSYHLTVAGRPVEQLYERDPAGSRLLGRQQPRERVGRQEPGPGGLP